MLTKEIFRIILRLYPADDRKEFGTEMWAVLEQRLRELDQPSETAYILFGVKESLGLLQGVASEWIPRFRRHSRSSLVSTAADCSSKGQSLPQELAQAHASVQIILREMEHAIAHHQFQRARTCSVEEYKARAVLQGLERKYRLLPPNS